MSFDCTQAGSSPCSLDTHDLGVLQREAVPCHGDGNVESAGPDGEHPDRAGHGRVRVGTYQELTGFGEPLEVDIMRDSVAGAGVADAVARRE